MGKNHKSFTSCDKNPYIRITIASGFLQATCHPDPAEGLSKGVWVSYEKSMKTV
jgi:hypothetical protein